MESAVDTQQEDNNVIVVEVTTGSSSLSSAPPPTTVATTSSSTLSVPKKCKLIALGFCGVDDTIHPHQCIILSYTYPQIEFGILFRPDKEGTSRYASKVWVDQLGYCIQHMKRIVPNHTMKLAAHLCSTRVNDVLYGNKCCYEFIDYLLSIGFTRIQINATAVNGVDTSQLSNCVSNVLQVIQYYQKDSLEFIIQKNDETRPLWEPIEDILRNQTTIYTNISMLLDESKGTGIVSNVALWPTPSKYYITGYAGGIGPSNVHNVVKNIVQLYDNNSGSDNDISNNTVFWIDMESSLRSIKNNVDVFDLDKCYQIIDILCTMQLMERPIYLPSLSLSSSNIL